MKKLRDSRLLVLTDRYPHIMDHISASFVKNQIEYLKDYVENVCVISLAPFVPKFLSHFGFMDGKGRWDGYAKDYKYDNVEVYFAKPWALPLEFSRRRRGDDGFRNAKQVIKRNKIEFDLIHAHFTYPAGYVGARLKETYGKNLILTVHEDRNWFLNEIVSVDSKILYSWQNADRIIRVNKADLKEFAKININRSKLVYIPNGFSSELFKPIDKKTARKKLNLPKDKDILLNVAALEAYKGQKYLIRAMKAVISSKEDAILYIVGKGSLRNHLQSLLEQNGLQDHVVLAGGDKSIEEIVLWMNACDVFVLPSLNESFGIVQIEAMACGKSVVATRNGGSEEIVINDKLGFLVDTTDAEGMAKAILKALDMDWNREYILDYSRQFTWKRIAQKIVELYDIVIRERSQG